MQTLVDFTQLIAIVLYCIGSYQNTPAGHVLAVISLIVATLLVLVAEEGERTKKFEVMGYTIALGLSYLASELDAIALSNLAWIVVAIIGFVNIPFQRQLRQIVGKE